MGRVAGKRTYSTTRCGPAPYTTSATCSYSRSAHDPAPDREGSVSAYCPATAGSAQSAYPLPGFAPRRVVAGVNIVGRPGDLQVGPRPGHGAPQAWHHVVIPAAAAVAVLRIINLTNIHDDPQTLQVVLKRQHPAVIAPAGSSSSKRSGLPVAALTRRWFFTVQPAALSRASALSKLARSKPSPRETGGW